MTAIDAKDSDRSAAHPRVSPWRQPADRAASGSLRLRAARVHNVAHLALIHWTGRGTPSRRRCEGTSRPHMVSRSERKDSGQEKPDGLGSRVEAPAAAQQQVGTRAGRGGAGGKVSGGARWKGKRWSGMVRTKKKRALFEVEPLLGPNNLP